MSPDRSEWATPLPRAGPDRLRAIAPAALLAAIAILGVRNFAVHDQSSWQGASFGMFATYDNDVSRVVAVTATGPQGSYRVRLPKGLQDDAVRLRVAPSAGAADRLAREVAALIRDVGTTSVTVELWGIVLHDTDGFWLRFEPIVVGRAAR